jgi:hypothetical protein
MNKETQREFLRTFFIFLVAAAYITICSKSSWLYPYNDWDDINIYKLMGQQLLNGKISYTEVWEQKGPIVFLIYALTNLIPGRYFTGLYMLEVLQAFLFLYISYKTCKIICSECSILVVPVIGLIYSSKIIRGGGCSEEIFLPMIMYSMYIYIKYMYNNEKPSRMEAFELGISAGIILLSKYTILATIIAVYICLMIQYIKEKEIKEYIKLILYTLLGALVIVVPTSIYLYTNNALTEMFQIYFIDNIFGYNNQGNILIWIVYAFVVAPFFFSIILVSFSVMLSYYNKLHTLIIFTILFLVTFMKRSYGYYEIPLAVILPVAIALIIKRFKDRIPKAINKTQYKLTISLFLIVISFILTPNAYLRQYKIWDLPQYKFAKIIGDDSMLCATYLDLGFYTFANKEVPTYYICTTNLDTDNQIQFFVDEVNKCEYTYVVLDQQIKNYFDMNKYELVSTETFTRDALLNYDNTYYLYKLK